MNTTQAYPWVCSRTAGDESLARILVNLETAGVQAQMIPDSRGHDGASLAQAGEPDLLVYMDRDDAWWPRLFFLSPVRQIARRIKASLLFVRQPRWPIRRILLIVRAEPTDWVALDWVMRAAQPPWTSVSILPIVPSWPSLYRYSRHIQPAPNVLLAPNTVSGAMLRRMIRRFEHRHISAHLLLGSGEPDCRIRRVVSSCDPDLVVVAAETHPPLLRWLCGELVDPLLRWIDRPLLVAR